ncbi:MAG TPA: MMPL family transporter [Streptosporangiaceae bacterium]|nr:MMPL family transporter [Streptosporangiaceae bacterium]
MERIAGWSARHRKTAVLGWLALVAVVFVGGQMIGTKDLPAYDPGQSGRAERVLDRLGFTIPPAESVLIQAKRPGVTYQASGDMRHAVGEVTAALRGLPHSAASIHSPGGHGGAGLISANGRAVLVTFKVPGKVGNADAAVVPALRAVAAVQAKHPDLRVAEAGDASTDRAATALVSHDFRKAEETSVPVSLVLLVVVFGALIAAGIPLLLAATAVMSAISLLAIPSHWLPVGQSTSEVVLILGMAVGIDYSLFYLRREREERARGVSHAQALRIAAATSGRAIVVSGLTVMIAMAGLFLTGYSVFSGVAIGTITVVGVAVIGSLTVLPALLAWLGRWADRGKIPFLGRRRTAARPSRLWGALARRVIKHPLAWGTLGVVALLALAAPALGLRLGSPPNGGFPPNAPVLRTLNNIQAAFPQTPSPAIVVVSGHDLAAPAVTHAIAELRSDTTKTGPIRQPVTATSIAHGRGLIVQVPLAGTGSGPASNHALGLLRGRYLPATLGKVQGLSYSVTGWTASDHDDIKALHDSTPLVFGVVALLAFGLLLVAFRSVAIPLVSIALNLLSVAGAYGLLTLVFQDGRFEGVLGYSGYGAIVPWVPLFIFVFLFGLSMDYHVFILSRIRELRLRGATTPRAIEGGIANSAGVVTSAAVIMVAVFSILASLSIVQLKMVGIGLAAAVLIDATVVRGILLPAALALLGDRSWYLPRWLNWVPGGRARPELAAATERLETVAAR